VFIYVTIDKQMKKLVVRKTHLEHNHPCGSSRPAQNADVKRRKRRRKKEIEDKEFTDDNIERTVFAEDINIDGFAEDRYK